MHVALVSYEFPPANAIGGIGAYMHHLSVILTKAGHRVTVFSADPNANYPYVIGKANCFNWLVPATDNKAFREAVLPVFEEFLETNKVDVIESPEVGACALLIKEKFPHMPLVVKMHTPGVLITKVNNTYVSLASKLRFVAGALVRGKIDAGYWANHDKNRDTDAEYKICMIADALLSPSVALKKWAVRFWGIPAIKIKVIPNPFSVDDELFQLPFENRPAVISFIGKLSILKGMKAFTKAIPHILKKNKGYKILLVGRDEVESGQSMQAYMEDHLKGWLSDIVFTGSLDKEELKAIYASSRVCVVPSLWENYPTVVMEAMAAGAAVAASRVGGIPELITNNITGMLFDAMKPAQIAAAVNQLLADEEKRLAMAATARRALQQRMNDSEYEQALLQVYTQYENVRV